MKGVDTHQGAVKIDAKGTGFLSNSRSHRDHGFVPDVTAREERFNG